MMHAARDPAGIFIAAGANLGDRAANIRGGLHALESDGVVQVLRVSTLHETAAVGGPANQPNYLNAVAQVETRLGARELLKRMLEIEQRFGRIRAAGATERNGPRTLDLDLLIYRDIVADEPGLTLPHPRMWQRAFVLRPLAEICDIDVLRRHFGIVTASSSVGRAAPC
jgi:2-amino-4-hydroxy-6-hydroxymethyldihydropteridine diphosphokinase